MTRRELMKYFGAGSIIAPVAMAEPVARLIEPPKIEIIQATAIPDSISFADVERIDIALRMKDGTSRHLSAEPLRAFGELRLVDEADISIKSIIMASPQSYGGRMDARFHLRFTPDAGGQEP